jgi:hypothetical protein
VDIHFSQIITATRNKYSRERQDGFLVACSDAAVTPVLVVRDGSRAGAVRCDSLRARVCNRGSKEIGVVALIGEQIIEGKTAG